VVVVVGVEVALGVLLTVGLEVGVVGGGVLGNEPVVAVAVATGPVPTAFSAATPRL
jgi:hypothetical protein